MYPVQLPYDGICKALSKCSPPMQKESRAYVRRAPNSDRQIKGSVLITELLILMKSGLTVSWHWIKFFVDFKSMYLMYATEIYKSKQTESVLCWRFLLPLFRAVFRWNGEFSDWWSFDAVTRWTKACSEGYRQSRWNLTFFCSANSWCLQSVQSFKHAYKSAVLNALKTLYFS